MGDGVRIFQLTELEVFGAGYTEAQPSEFDGGPTTANLLSEPSSEPGRATRLGELYDRDAQIAYAYRARLVQDYVTPDGRVVDVAPNLLVDRRRNAATNTTGGIAPQPQSRAAGELSLGVNERYRDALLLAQRRTGIDAAAIAGLINAEAARDRSGRWIADSYNELSGARGLTQFLAGTWIDRATTAGTYLNDVAVRRGFVRRDENGRFVVTDRQSLLDLRNDPTASIVSAAEYGRDNLAGLGRLGLLPADLTDDQRARYIYYAHHEGFAGAVRLLTDSRGVTEDAARVALVQGRGRQRALASMREHGSYAAAFRAWTEERARYLFPTQVGAGRDGRRIIDRYVAEHGDYEHGYRAWLEEYTARQ